MLFRNDDNTNSIRNNHLVLLYALACICLLLTSGLLTPSIIPSGFAKSNDDKDTTGDDKSGNKKSSRSEETKSGGEDQPPDSKRESKGTKSGGKDKPPDDEPTNGDDKPTKPHDDKPTNGDKIPSESSTPTIITNTVTSSSTTISNGGGDGDEDENEGPTKFAFIDSYFTDQIVTASLVAGSSSEFTTAQDIPPVRKLEVGPGEGDSTLALILINRGFSDVTGIRATLDFPTGFKAIVSPRNIDSDTALSSYNGLVDAGKTFTLYFPVTVSENTQVGKEYIASLNIKYFNMAEKDEENTRDRTIKVPFKLSGKVILDAISFPSSTPIQSVNQSFPDINSNFSNVVSLVPGSPNVVKTLIKNEGSAAATGVVVNVIDRNQQDQFDNNNVIPTATGNGNISTTTVQQSTVIPLITAGTTSFNVGTIPAGGSTQINPIIFPGNSVGNILENIGLQISYNDAYGNRKALNELLGIQILPSSPQSGLSITPDVPISNTIGKMSLPDNTVMNNGEDDSFSNNTNGDENNNKYTYPFTQVSDYTNNTGFNSNELVNNDGDEAGTFRNDNFISLVAGKVDDLKFNITNSNNKPITDAVVSLDSDSSAIKILGDSKWNLNKIEAHTTQQFLTSVLASKSLINSPASFKVSMQYIYNSQAKSDSFNLGANVVGDITVNINDLAINYIGGTPNLVGNLLNKGNTLALFTSIELARASSTLVDKHQQEPSSTISKASENKSFFVPVTSFPQYLGDLEENSPLPFSIPLAINNDTASGVYPVSLKVTYSDDLRNSYTDISNGTVEFISPISTGNQGQGFLGFDNIMIVMVIAIIMGIVAVITIARLRSKKSSRQQQNNEAELDEGDNQDIETLLDNDDSTDKRNIQKK